MRRPTEKANIQDRKHRLPGARPTSVLAAIVLMGSLEAAAAQSSAMTDVDASAAAIAEAMRARFEAALSELPAAKDDPAIAEDLRVRFETMQAEMMKALTIAAGERSDSRGLAVPDETRIPADLRARFVVAQNELIDAVSRVVDGTSPLGVVDSDPTAQAHEWEAALEREQVELLRSLGGSEGIAGTAAEILGEAGPGTLDSAILSRISVATKDPTGILLNEVGEARAQAERQRQELEAEMKGTVQEVKNIESNARGVARKLRGLFRKLDPEASPRAEK